MKNIYSVKEKLHFDYFHVDTKTQCIESLPSVKLTLKKDLALKDHYQLRISKNYHIEMTYGHERALIYAFDYLSSCQEMIETGIYEDGPDFELRGIIEGFYGIPWTHEDRLDVLDFLYTHRMNAYFYAPKDDIYHRQAWRTPYPTDKLNQLVSLIEKAKQRHIDFYFCISPGADFDYTKKEEFEVLYKKIDQLLEHGIKHVCLLMDDIDYQLKGKALTMFETPGRAHAHITNQLHAYLTSKLNDFKLIMCPTEYWQNYDTPYRQTLKTWMHEDVMVFWTGYNTIAEFIPNQDGEKVFGYFGHPVVLWDNYPVNDMTKDRIFMGPLVNRGNKLYQTHIGMVSNPMIEWHLSKPSVITMARYMWDSHTYDPEEAYLESIEYMTMGQPQLFQDLKVFMDNNRHSLISYDVIESLEFAIENLDMALLKDYFVETKEAFDRLKKTFDHKRFIEQATPWFEAFDLDFNLFLLIINQKATQEDTAYIHQRTHTIGTHAIAKIAKKLGLYDGDIYQKNRINYWDQT